MNTYGYVGNNAPNLTDPSGEIVPVLMAAGAVVAGHAASSAIVWATMKAVSHSMGNPEIPGTVGNYRMGNLSDDMALAAFGTGVLATPAALAPACAGAGGFAAVQAAPSVYYATMAAAGSPMGQRVLAELPDFVENYVTPAPPTKIGWGALIGWVVGGAPAGGEGAR